MFLHVAIGAKTERGLEERGIS